MEGSFLLFLYSVLGFQLKKSEGLFSEEGEGMKVLKFLHDQLKYLRAHILLLDVQYL